MDTSGALDFACSDSGLCSGNFWGRLILKLSIIYVVCGIWAWDELRYRAEGTELTAKAQVVGEVRQCGRWGCHDNSLVRYEFRDPKTGTLRHNTVTVPKKIAPDSGTAQIQFLPGEYPQSRLLSQARPSSVWAFGIMSVMLLVACLGFIGHAAWLANRKYLTPQQRMMVAYRRKQAALAATANQR